MENLHPEQHEVALELRELVYLVDSNLQQAIEGDPVTSPEYLDAARQGLEAMRKLANHHDFVNLPTLDSAELEMARFACAYYQSGACDTLTEDERTDFLDIHAQHLTQLEGVGRATARRLFSAGVYDPQALLAMSDEALAELPDLDTATRNRLQASLASHRDSH
ncbi:helix-hairpin-helix domain-containing protein [Pistricoccus aurantiacus]|nr:helix-hairpin-helix domain-containing protein [Pistricoccus aurantiacus]